MSISALAETASPPRVIPGPTRHFTPDMIDDWLLGRLEKVWPGRTEAYWRGRFGGFLQSNDYLMLCNDRAVMVAERKMHPITSAATVWVLFCWSRDTLPGEWLEKSKVMPMIELYRGARRWLTDMNGERMLCGLCDDLRYDHLADQWLMQRAAEGGLVVDLRPYKAKGGGL